LLLDEAAKLRKIVGPLPPELRRAGDFAPLRHRLQLAWFEPEDYRRLLGRAALTAFGDALGLDDGAARRLALLSVDQCREPPRKAGSAGMQRNQATGGHGIMPAPGGAARGVRICATGSVRHCSLSDRDW